MRRAEGGTEVGFPDFLSFFFFFKWEVVEGVDKLWDDSGREGEMVLREAMNGELSP